MPLPICIFTVRTVVSPGFMVVEPTAAWALQQPSSRLTSNWPRLSGPVPVFLSSNLCSDI